MSPERAKQLFEAIQILREAKDEIATVAPLAEIVSPVAGTVARLAVEFEPAAETILTIYFEAVAALRDAPSADAARAQLADRLRAHAEALLGERFPDG